MNRPIDGVLPVDKPAGPTSHDVVGMARRALGTRRIGHTGTLDPFASGLLLLCVERATRVAEYLTALPKTYEATARLGAQTATDDATGEVISESNAWQTLTEADVQNVLLGFVGSIDQTPPAFSAKKVGGERLYQKARRGELVLPDAARVTIHAIDGISIALPDVRFTVHCSSGTYIRSIARDLGNVLGTGAHLTQLRRTRIGDFSVDRAIPVDRMADENAVANAWVNTRDAIAHMPHVSADDQMSDDLSHGRAVKLGDVEQVDGVVAVLHKDDLLAIASVHDGLLRPKKVFVS